MLVLAFAPRNRIGCLKRYLIFCVLFVGLSNYAAYCVAAQKEVPKSLDWAENSTANLDRNGAGPDAPEGEARQQKLPPRVSKFLTELEPADARALLGAFKQGYTIIKRLDDGFILARKSSQLMDSSALLVMDADFMISFNTTQINRHKESYASVITQGGFECKSARLALLYQQFQVGTFGTGASVSALESTKPVRFRSTSKGLGEFLSSVYCPK
ncbi:hypothetical protein N9O62_04080 [Burkholderiaceae bacterium]|jgi:hypothetical protein|nr:hypothetical protein [Burkholderiaceae bacterium]